MTSRADTSRRAIRAASVRALEKQRGETTAMQSNTGPVYPG